MVRRIYRLEYFYCPIWYLFVLWKWADAWPHKFYEIYSKVGLLVPKIYGFWVTLIKFQNCMFWNIKQLVVESNNLPVICKEISINCLLCRLAATAPPATPASGTTRASGARSLTRSTFGRDRNSILGKLDQKYSFSFFRTRRLEINRTHDETLYFTGGYCKYLIFPTLAFPKNSFLKLPFKELENIKEKLGIFIKWIIFQNPFKRTKEKLYTIDWVHCTIVPQKNSFFQNSKANTILLYLEKNIFPQYPKPI